MARRPTVSWLPWLLGALTILILANMIPDGITPLHSPPQLIIIMISVLAFMANIEVPLHANGISLDLPAALLTYLTVGASGYLHETFLVIAIGGAVGGVFLALW